MNIEVDLTVRALYLRLATGSVANTIELADAVVADVDEAGTVLGIEFVRIDRFAPFLAAHPDLVTLPRHMTYTSIDRNKTWQVEVVSSERDSNGNRSADAAALNAAFLEEIVTHPETVDRIADGETVVLHPARTPN